MPFFLLLTLLVAEPKGVDVVYLAPDRPLILRLIISREQRDFREHFQQAAEAVFDRLDADKDGSLSYPEATDAPWTQLLHNRGIELGSSSLPVDIDPDRTDQKITRKEWQTFVSALDVPIQLLISDSAQQGEASLFSSLDLDGDRALSEQELHFPPKWRMQFDRNDNEVFELNELLDFDATQAGRQPGVWPVRRSDAEDPIWLVTGDDRQRVSLAAVLIRKYGSGRVITPKGLWPGATTFNQFDADQDGRWNRQEVAQWLSAPQPDLQLRIQLQKSASQVQLIDGNGTNNTANSQVTIQGPTLKANIAVRDAGNNAAWKSELQNAMRTLDANNNGYLEPGEAASNGVLPQMYPRLDADGDRKLYPQEVEDFLQTHVEIASASIEIYVADQGRSLMHALDQDGDNKLSLREQRHAPSLLARQDLNGDGKLTTEELVHYQSWIIRPGQLSLEAFGLDVDNGAEVAFDASPPAKKPTGPLWFQKMDRNGDGDLSQREFLGTPEQFHMLDSDNDGLIDGKEASQAGR